MRKINLPLNVGVSSAICSDQRQSRVFRRNVWIAALAICLAGSDGGRELAAHCRARTSINETPVAEQTEPEFRLQGFLGDIGQVRLLPAAAIKEGVSCSTPSADIDLTGMARRAMHYLIHNPSPERGYETRFSISPLACPPSLKADQPDLTAEGDTENRMDWEFIFMREMTGVEEGKEVETAIWKRILGYLRKDGLSWARPYALGPREKDPERPCAMNWTTGLTLGSLLERYERDGNAEHLTLARKLFLGLRSLASWDTGRAYYEGGLSGWRNGRWLRTWCSPHAPSILMAVVPYWQVTHDPDALAFARAFADGLLAELQPGTGDYRIRPDGTYGGKNCHLHVRPVIGVAHLGVLTGDPRYISWARSVYEFTRSMGTDWGWFPESPRAGNSETCATGDMVDLARWLARAGYTEYWDHVERYVRNYVSQSQFFMTPEFRKIYRSAHKDKPVAEVDAGLALLSRYEGGFIARVYPNDLARNRTSEGMNMMGCCPPEAMRALHIAWSHVVTETKRGIEVNLALNRDHPAARVVSYLPHEGKVTVLARRDADFYLRPPSWTSRTSVQTYVDGKASTPAWDGSYIRFSGVKSGQQLTITYPLVDFIQRVAIDGKTYSYHWIGNTVVGVNPAGTILPLFTEVPRPLPSTKPGPEEPRRVLRLEPGPGNPRNSEGDFIRLQNGRVLFIYTHFTGGEGDHARAHLASRESRDDGQTWSATDKVVVANEGGMNVMSVSLLRLRSGPIALFYLRKNSERDCRPVLRFSRDEAYTWSEPVECITDEVGYYVLNNARVLQLASGRLVVPVAQHTGADGKWRPGEVLCYLSDDEGRTWRRGPARLTATADGKQVDLMEPGLVETTPNQLLMVIRTRAGCQYFARSLDGGEHWSEPEPSSIWSPESPATMTRIPDGKTLIIIWNDQHDQSKEYRCANPPHRTPLSLALSHDGGRTWEKSKTIENVPDAGYCYTAARWVGRRLLLGYCAHRSPWGLETTQVTLLDREWIER